MEGMGAPFPPDFGSVTLSRVHEDFYPVLIVSHILLYDRIPIYPVL